MTQQIVIIEGIDGVGKNTFHNLLRERRNFEDMHIIRSTATQWVYAQMFKRPIPIDAITAFEMALKPLNPLLVLLTCNPKIAQMRKYEDGLSYLTESQKYFLAYWQVGTCYTRKLMLATDTEKDLEEAINITVKELEAYD